jgi:hypothetical protein
MSRYKPKSLRFADDASPCILSIYVAESQKSPKNVYSDKEEKDIKNESILKETEEFYSDSSEDTSDLEV